MAELSTRRVFYGAFVHSVSLTELEYESSALLGVSETGTIAFIDRNVDSKDVPTKLAERKWDGAELVVLKRGEFLCPGLIDTHTHAPQYPNMGFGQQYELLDWLTHVTFPTEEKFSDPQYARRIYESVVQRVINSGTTTCCYYGTLHLTTKILAAVCHHKGQRAFVGKCNMDRNSAPTYQEDSTESSLADTTEFVNFVRSKCVSPSCAPAINGTASSKLPSPGSTGASNGTALSPYSRGNLVQPIITPRFAISCSDELLAGLGEMMAQDPDLALQTHLAENPSEIEFTKSLFPFAKSYTHVYDHFKLLRRNSVLAHCVHLGDEEMMLIKETQAGISHCPTSNYNLRSGVAAVTDMLDRGIKVSLGTDVSGGFGLGILSTLRQASAASKTIVFLQRDSLLPVTSTAPSSDLHDSKGQAYPAGFFSSRHLSIETLFYLATLGGAAVTCLDDRIGNFVVGKEFDALLVQSGQRESSEPAVSPTVEIESDDDVMAFTEGVEGSDGDAFNPAMFVEPDDSLQKIFEKFLFTGDDRNLGSVFVRGRRIGGARSLPVV